MNESKDPSTGSKYLYSIRESANILGIGRTKLYEMLTEGKLASIRIGTRRLVKVDSVMALIERATAGAA